MSSKVINNNENINFKNGFLYVKLPLNLGTFVGQYKIWSKKWIQFECIQNEDNFVSLSIFRNQKSENILYRKIFSAKNTAIFRCRSRTQNYAFTLCDNNVAIIHLSADSETESQLWMQYLRNCLWPPNPLMEFENSIKGHFYASIIDNENSHRSGLLGAYGYLQLSNANLVLTHPQTGHVIQEWLLFQHTFKNPFKNVLEVVKKRSSFSGIQNIVIYCKDANEILEKLNQINLDNRVNCRNELQRLSSNGCDSSSIINKRFGKMDDRNSQTSNLIKSNVIDCNTFRVRSLTEIPESMLNCSLSSNNFSINENQNFENIYSEPTEPSDPFDYIESDIYEDIDSIYEEIVTKDENNINFEFCSENNSNNLFMSSEPIEIRRNINNTEENQIFGYDMFSQIVKRTNIPLIDSKLSNKKSRTSKTVSNDPSDNDYCEMRPIDRQTVEGRYSSDNCEYVYMKSFSI